MVNKSFALITGASSGIGKEISKILFNMGYNLLITSRNQNELLKLKKELNVLDRDRKIEVVISNLSTQDGANIIFQYTKANNINVEVLVNNAGAGIYGEITNLECQEIINMLMLNIYSLTCLSSLYAKEMKLKKAGYILNIGSLAAYQPVPYIAPYAASKSYVLNFSEAIAMELKEYGVTVSCVSPGHTNTNFFNNANISDNHKFYGMDTRVDAYKVAKYAVNSLFSKKLSRVYGMKNKFLSLLNKITPRILIAHISKYLVSAY